MLKFVPLLVFFVVFVSVFLVFVLVFMLVCVYDKKKKHLDLAQISQEIYTNTFLHCVAIHECCTSVIAGINFSF